MNTRYCLCGARNDYTVTKPKVCSNCGCDMDKAFSSAAAATVVVATPAPAPAPTRHLTQATRQAPAITRRRRPVENEEEAPEAYDQDEVEILANEMAQEVAGSELFSVGVDDEYRPLKLGSLANVREAATKRSQEKVAPKRKSRK